MQLVTLHQPSLLSPALKLKITMYRKAHRDKKLFETYLIKSHEFFLHSIFVITIQIASMCPFVDILLALACCEPAVCMAG